MSMTCGLKDDYQLSIQNCHGSPGYPSKEVEKNSLGVSMDLSINKRFNAVVKTYKFWCFNPTALLNTNIDAATPSGILHLFILSEPSLLVKSTLTANWNKTKQWQSSSLLWYLLKSDETVKLHITSNCLASYWKAQPHCFVTVVHMNDKDRFLGNKLSIIYRSTLPYFPLKFEKMLF